MSPADAIREHYDSLALIYRHYWGDHLHHGMFLAGTEAPADAQLALLDYCATACGIGSGDRVLDVGCGYGGPAVYLATKWGCSVAGITLSEKQARIAREKAALAGVSALTEFHLGDVEQMDFPPAAYDLAWTMESSEHFADKPGYFRKIASVLKPGGKLLLAAWTGSMEHERVRAIADASVCPELLTAAEYSTLIEAAGLQLCHLADLGAQVAPTWNICQQHARKNRAIVALLPRAARRFISGIDLIVEAYGAGELTYTVLVAQKPATP